MTGSREARGVAAAHLVQGRQLLKAPTSLLLASYFLRRGPKTQGQPGRSLVEKHKKGSIKSARSASGLQGHVTGAGPGPPASPEEQLPGFTFHAQDLLSSTTNISLAIISILKMRQLSLRDVN